MSLDKKKLELNELLLLAYDGVITQEQLIRLNQLMADEPESLLEYQRFVDLAAELSPYGQVSLSEDSTEAIEKVFRDHIALNEQLEALEEEKLLDKKRQEIEKTALSQLKNYLDNEDRSIAEPPASKERTKESSFNLSNYKIKMVALAACLFVGISLWVFTDQLTRLSVVSIINSSDAKWEFEPDHIVEGQEYQLLSGLIEIEFKQMAKMVVQGPSTFVIESPTNTFLQEGEISAHVYGDDDETGFMVNTPSSSIIDYGTGFCVSVDGNGDSEVHVFEGEVGVMPIHAIDGRYTTVKAGAAMAIDKDGLEMKHLVMDVKRFRNTFSSDFFQVSNSAPGQYEQYIHQTDPIKYYSFNQPLSETFDGEIVGVASTESVESSVYAKNLKNSMRLRDNKSYLVSQKIEKPLGNVYSFSFWMKYDSDNVGDSLPILSTRLHDQINSMSSAELFVDTTGYLIFLVYDKYSVKKFPLKRNLEFSITSQQRLNPDQWYFVVVTVDAKGDLVMYIDSEESRRKSFRLMGDLLAWDIMYVGQHYVDLIETRSVDRKDSFSGNLDEIAFYDRLLSEKEIKEMHSLARE